jgi:hypothetical protein
MEFLMTFDAEHLTVMEINLDTSHHNSRNFQIENFKYPTTIQSPSPFKFQKLYLFHIIKIELKFKPRNELLQRK